MGDRPRAPSPRPPSFVRPLLVLALLLGALAACDDRPSEDSCAALLERFVELEVEEGGTAHLGAAMKADLDKQKKDLREYLSEPFIEDCQKNMAVDVVACGLEARTKSALAACEE